MAEYSVHIGILSVELHIPQAGSLKAKRWVLKSLKDKVRSKYNVSLAEVGARDKWQRSILVFGMVGPDQGYLNGCLDSILSFLETFGNIRLVNHQLEFL